MSDSVAQNLANADKQDGLDKACHEALTTEAGGVGAENHPDPSVFGLDATVWVSLAMLVFLAVLVWKGGLRAIVGGLDKQIAAIRNRLDEAKQLRAEAEALRDEYARKLADVENQTAAMVDHARAEAAALMTKAEKDAADLVQRRAQMAEDKIASAERTALAEIRAKTAEAAATAAATLIAAKHGVSADKALVDRTITGLGRPN
jgi:F-type H+-transporting ATPase subunit b